MGIVLFPFSQTYSAPDKRYLSAGLSGSHFYRDNSADFWAYLPVGYFRYTLGYDRFALHGEIGTSLIFFKFGIGADLYLYQNETIKTYIGYRWNDITGLMNIGYTNIHNFSAGFEYSIFPKYILYIEPGYLEGQYFNYLYDASYLDPGFSAGFHLDLGLKMQL